VNESGMRLRIAGDIDGLAGALQEVRTFLQSAGASARGIYRAELVLDELITNIIKYAHGGAADPIDVEADVEGDEIVIAFEDRGKPFNPLDAGSFSPATSLEEARTGGYGLALVRMAATKIDYERGAHGNRVTVRIARD